MRRACSSSSVSRRADQQMHQQPRDRPAANSMRVAIVDRPAARRSVRCSARSTMKAPNSRPPQIRWADSHLAVASSNSTSRRAGSSGASTLVAAARASAAIAMPNTRPDDAAARIVRISSNWSSSSSTTKTAIGAVSARRSEHRQRGERHAVARADARDEGAPPPPADQPEGERPASPRAPGGERHARRAALVARIARSSPAPACTTRSPRRPAAPRRHRARNRGRARWASGGTWSPHRRSGAVPTACPQAASARVCNSCTCLIAASISARCCDQPRALGRDCGVLGGASRAGAGPSPFSRASRSASRGSRSASLSRSSSRSGESRCDRSVSVRTPCRARRGAPRSGRARRGSGRCRRAAPAGRARAPAQSKTASAQAGQRVANRNMAHP